MLPRYQRVYKYLKHDGLFLYNYGAELNQVGKYSESVHVLKTCRVYFNDMDLLLLLADNYFHLQMYREAESCLLLASEMCPVRFTPLYWLMRLYLSEGNNSKAIEYAKMIVKKPIKIDSFQVRNMKS